MWRPKSSSKPKPGGKKGLFWATLAAAVAHCAASASALAAGRQQEGQAQQPNEVLFRAKESRRIRSTRHV